MTDNPKDHCTVVETFITHSGEILAQREHVTHYKDVTHPRHLPEVLLSEGPEVINEWATYKKWEIDQMAEDTKREWKEKINRMSWRKQSFSWRDLREGDLNR